jgi:mono/diheme cytochrome c family protein
MEENGSMQKLVKVGAVMGFLLAGIFIFSTRETQALTALATFESEASPRSLYSQNCARCHGSNGKAQTSQGRKLEADDLTTSTASTDKIIRMITNGRGDMPGFKRKLTAAQISSIAGYVKGLQ